MKILSFIAVAFFLSNCTAIVVDKPTRPNVVVIPDSPGPAYVWISDSWKWNRRTRTYTTKPGYWVKPNKKSMVWVDGHWVNTRSGWKYVKGHWRSVG